MRVSPSGPRIPNEILRYTFSIVTGDAGKVIAPLPYAQASTVDTTGPSAIFALFIGLPGALDVGDVTVVSGGGNTGSKISCRFALVTVVAGLPIVTPVGTPFEIDPTLAGGVSFFRIDESDVIIPDTGAGIVLQVTVPGDVVINSTLTILLGVGANWKPSAIRNPLI